MRNYDELVRAALSLRYKLIEEQKPPNGVFHITQEEACVLKDQAPVHLMTMDIERRTLCGLTLRVI